MTLDDLIAREQIRDVVYRYARGVDRRDYELVRSCYHPNATDDHGSYKGDVDGFITWLGAQLSRWSVTSHTMANILIDLHDDVARVETYAVAYHRTVVRDGKDPRDITAGVRYVDDMRRIDGAWAISRRVVVSDWVRVDDVPAGSIRPDDPYVQPRPFPHDEVYRPL
ncbi:MAG: nuclear transport factor 2 family protein [Acidimicrobiia bacterium]|nr:nuclear transport factor 2 family protein [Acidimicrobiia bacterium]